MEISLNKKVIVISGGTKGVGKQLALQCAADGAHVVISGRDEASATSIIEAAKKSPGTIEFKKTDLHNVSSIRELFAYVADKYSKLDGFVNYAGITPAASLIECSESLFDDVFDIDIKAAFFCCQEAVKLMQKTGGGSIVLVGSTHHTRGKKDRTAYACAKGALYTLSNHIGRHYAEDKIRCNYLVMGWTPTDGELALRKSQGMTEKELREKAAKAIPMGRMTEASDIVPGIMYLLCDSSAMLTGSEFTINGGELI
ncbi:SDR family NAD(P)-dependent oxidoreductase [Fibrobacter succinogenes]|uniref:SDR family NAD(P)-dependent oxidoreductase n=1 Tax=Fibrobacter succinogenes TaxID=833 RepID=UPI00156853DC|nr:SDR family oxidoreductase [Fibrobacter succinogenes]